MNLYEHTIVARQDISPSQIKQLTEKYSKIVEKNKGNIVQTENWGLLNLSYVIKKNRKGNYIHFKIKGSGKIIEELETRKLYRKCKVDFKNYSYDLDKKIDEIKFSDLELIFKNLKDLFIKQGYAINWKELEKQSLDQTINALAMPSPFSLEI